MLKCVERWLFPFMPQNVGWMFTVRSVSERTERLILSSTFVSDSENWSYFKSTFLWHLILRDSACSDLLVRHLILTCMMMNIWNLDKTHFMLFYLDCNELHLRKTTACLRWCKRYLNWLMKVHLFHQKYAAACVQGSIKLHQNLYPHLLNPMTLSLIAVTLQHSKHQPTTKIHKKTLLRPCGRYEKTSMRSRAENWKGTSYNNNSSAILVFCRFCQVKTLDKEMWSFYNCLVDRGQP